MLELPYGRTPYPLDLGGRAASVLSAPTLPTPPAVEALIEAALASSVIPGAARVVVIVSDNTRIEPRGAFLAALAPHLPAGWTLAIATGTHGPANIAGLGIPDELLRGRAIVNHDGHSPADLVTLGTTRYGTPVRVHRCLVEADLVIATGCIRPHYFAGFGAGTKAIFPGLGEATAIRINHRLKTADGARAGIVDENPCRRDLEEAFGLLPTPTFLLNGVTGPDGRVHAVVAGNPITEFRRGCDLARPWFTVRSSRASLVIASDALPVTASLYQAAKIASAMAPLVAANGRLVVVAECADGVEPLETVNEAIFRIGVLPRLAPGARLQWLSGVPDAVARKTLLEPISSIDLDADSIVVVPRASQLIVDVEIGS